jgi:tRNA(Ile)-lysidine synthase
MSRDEDMFWEEETEKYYRVMATGGGMPVLDCGSLKELPVALRRRLIRRAVREAKGDLQRIDYRHVESMMALLDRRGGGRVVAPGVEVVRSMEWIRFTPAGYRDVHDGSAVLLAAPGEVTLPDGICLRLRSVPPERGYNGGEAGNRVDGPDKEDKLDWDRMDGPLTLRWWVPGDAYRRTGAKQAEKIKQMFQMARIPLWERHFWPIIEAGKDIVWSRRFGPSAEHQATSSSRRVLGVREIPAE